MTSIVPTVIFFLALALVITGIIELQRAYDEEVVRFKNAVVVTQQEEDIPYDAFASRVHQSLWNPPI